MGISEALQMVSVFESVGASRFDLTRTDINGQKQGFRSGMTGDGVKQAMPHLLATAAAQHHNVILRPHAPATQLVQLDDLDAAAIERVRDCAFLILATSPGNHQAWVAVTGSDTDIARRLRKGVKADASASGATRIAGMVNYKRKYAPEFPAVRIAAAAPGRIVAATDLERLGLVAMPEQGRGGQPTVRTPPPRSGRRAWPSYARCLASAPPNHGGTAPDISRADFAWCMIAIDWGWSIDDTAARLMQESSKAQENGERYAVLTAGNAAAAVERRRNL